MKFPIGIQTFSEIIRGGYVYVDKTDLVWQLKEEAKYIFLSRPRRFGKSLLTSTLDAYFQGKKELFSGLKIMQLESEWAVYPVIHLDLSTAKSQASPDSLRNRLLLMLENYAETYGRKESEVTPGGLLQGLITRAYTQTGRQVVVLVDEYDAPLLDILHDDILAGMRHVMQEFYAPLKACEAMVKFCFITGITKFSQLSIFSSLNNIKNVTLNSRFSAICGITEQEVKKVFAEEIMRMALVYNITPEQLFQKIKERYDGYHFAAVSDDIYNPYSLLNAFADKELRNYWFESGTPSFLIQQMKMFQTDIMSLDNLMVPSSAFDQPTENMSDALPLLYQSGYLTIKEYDRDGEVYSLSIPNQEVRVGYTEGLLPAYTGLKGADVQMGFALKFWRALRKDDVDQALREMQVYMASIPYVEGFKKKLADAATSEGFWEYTMYLIFSMLNVYVRTQVKCAGGRADMVVRMPGVIYVFEFKISGTAQDALEQIESKGYAIPYSEEGSKLVKVGVRFNAKTRMPEEWAIKS